MLRLSRMTDYAVVILCRMATDSGTGVLTAPALAEATGLPHPTVAKLLKILARRRLLWASRGAAGGYALARPPGMISVQDIVLAVEGPLGLVPCVDGTGRACGFETACVVRGRWEPVNAAVARALADVSLAQLAGETGRRSQAASASTELVS